MPSYKSQAILLAQSCQAVGKVMEKLARVTESIKFYTQGKNIIEQVFGTQHPLFKECIDLMSTARSK